jgi:formylglycine-generating enzyme required for sulfatase activity
MAPKYRAFISYSHADTTWAKWLQRGLEAFKIDKDLAGRETSRGAIPDVLRPIFRDREDFTAGEALPEQTLAALDTSNALIVVCSPDSAKSNYVNEEARLFQLRHPRRQVIPLIVGGKPGDPELECFPPALKFKLDTKGRITKKKAELLAADVREEGDGEDLALAKVIAGLLGLSSDEVFRRAERERRVAVRRKRRVQILVGTLALIPVLAGVGWLNQDYLRDQYYWRVVMGPTVLTAAEERTLKPGYEFKECASGCPVMVVLPAGEFMMGSPEGQGHVFERPKHAVTIPKPFAVSKYEVTFAEWDACVVAGGCAWHSDSGWGRGDRPAIYITWDDAKQYVTWLSKFSGKTYRLLAEAEWEYAARVGTTTLYFFGDDAAALGEYAWYGDNSGFTTQPVGKKKPNAFGLHDIYGNVSEWVEDVWHNNYDGAPSDGSAWVEGGDVSSRAQRGGSWIGFFDFSSASRSGHNTISQSQIAGFRVGRTLAH